MFFNLQHGQARNVSASRWVGAAVASGDRSLAPDPGINHTVL